MHRRSASFPALFTVICLAVIVGITVSVSAVFFITFRSLSYNQIEINTRENLNHLRDKVVDRFREWSELITYVAIGAAPIMACSTCSISFLIFRKRRSCSFLA